MQKPGGGFPPGFCDAGTGLCPSKWKRRNSREASAKGDTITRFAPNIYALLLPTVNYNTGGMVLERIKRSFYKSYPNSNIVFNYRVGPLSSKGMPKDDMLDPRE